MLAVDEVHEELVRRLAGLSAPGRCPGCGDKTDRGRWCSTPCFVSEELGL